MSVIDRYNNMLLNNGTEKHRSCSNNVRFVAYVGTLKDEIFVNYEFEPYIRYDISNSYNNCPVYKEE